MMSVLLFALALGGNPTEGSRVAVDDDTLEVDSTNWGRTCSSLQTRFTDQGGNLGELEGARQFVMSISVMRTLRRANARSCDWAMSGEVDVSAVMQVVNSTLSKAPCYEQARTAAQAAQNLPEAERDQAMDAAAVLLLSDNCEADAPEPPELDASDDDLEEEMDDTTDAILDQVAVSTEEGASLLEQNPIQMAGYTWQIAAYYGGFPWIVASILMGIVLGLLCRALIHLIVRIFRWIRCSLFGNSCSEYKPSTWLKGLVGGGCHIGGMVFGASGVLYSYSAALYALNR